MIVERKSPRTGEVNRMDLNITQAQLDELARPDRRLLQQIFPDLTQAEREFVKTGYTQEDWDAIFPPEDQDK